MLEAGPVLWAPPFGMSRDSLNDENCRFAKPVAMGAVKGWCARDAPPHAFDISVLSVVETNLPH